MRWRGWVAASVLVICITSAAQAGGQVALTFDDLPVHGPVPAGVSRTELFEQIVTTLRNAGAPPTYGFINAKGLEDGEDNRAALRLWRAAGHPLANHTYSHMDLHQHDAGRYKEEVIANEPILQELMGEEDWRWFRYPYLREGETLDKRNAIRTFLDERGYRIAQVTIDFQDYAYNAPYVRCLERRDLRAIEQLKANYLARADERLSASEEASRRLYGRNIKHVMLLHVGAFQPLVLPHLFELLERRGYTMVTLQDAQSDRAYEQMNIRKELPSMGYDAEGLRRLEDVCSNPQQ